MENKNKNLIKNISHLLKSGRIGILPTDTIYGLVGSALNPEVVERIYKVRQRSPKKPMIILISDIKDVEKFKVKLNLFLRNFLKNIWPSRISVVLPSPNKKFFYLHRGTKSLAFRLPTKKLIQDLLGKTGPLVAPSANPEGVEPAETIKQAKEYFGEAVDFYLSAGKRLKSAPSTLIKIENQKVKVLRQGADFKKIQNFLKY